MRTPHFHTIHQRYVAGRLVLFVGAGVAMAGGLPSRTALIHRVLAYARIGSPAPETSAILDRAADLLARGDLLLALSELQRAMTAAGYGEAICRALDDAPHAVPPLAKAIADLAPTLQGVVTTNLDRFLERAFAGAWPVYTFPQLDLGQREHTILKLHGCRTDRSSWVLTRREYDALIHRRPEFRDHMRGLYRSATLLFVGYGLHDPDLDSLLAEFRALAAGVPPQHFALMPRGQVDEASRRHLFAEAGLTILEYDPGANHHELLAILVDLAATQPGAPPPVVPLPADVSPSPVPSPSSPTVAATSKRKQALHKLLCSLFTEAHLRRFLGFGEHGDAILQALPGCISSLAQLVDGAVVELARRGLMAALWPRLRAEFSTRVHDIDRVAAAWSTDAEQQSGHAGGQESAFALRVREAASGSGIVQVKDPPRSLSIEQLSTVARRLLRQSAPRTVISLFQKCSPALEQGIAALRCSPRRLICRDDEKKPPKSGLDLLDTPELHYIILGPPGIGKTFFLWQLADSLLTIGRHIPLFVRAGELDSTSELMEVIAAAAPGLRAEDVLYDPRTIVLFDGWSEFASENRQKSMERARTLRLLADKRLIATCRREAFVDPAFSPLELDPVAWSDVLKVIRAAIPGAAPPSGLSELLRLPLPLILYLLSEGRATTRGELLAELHYHLSMDLPSEFRDVLAGAVADVDIGATGRRRSAFLENLRHRAGKRGLSGYENCLRRLGTLEISADVVSPVHDLYWSWLSGVGLITENRIQAMIRQVRSHESVRLAIESGVPVDPAEISAAIGVDIVFAAQLSLGVPPDQVVCDELRGRIALGMASPLASQRARAALAALIVKEARLLTRAIEIMSEAISRKKIFNPDEIEFDVEFLYEHRAVVGEQLGSPAAGYLLARIAERGDPRWVQWLAEMAREGKAPRHQLVGAALACSAELPEWTREHLHEIVREHAYELRQCTKRGTNVALANWIAERFGEEVIPGGSAVFHLAELLGACGDDTTRQRLLTRVDSLSEQMLQLLGYTVAKFGEPWIGRFQERIFARIPSKGHRPLTEIVSASVSEAVARKWVVSEDEDVSLLGWRVLIDRIGPAAVAAELLDHMPVSFDGVNRVPAIEALQYVTDVPDELGKHIWRRIKGTLTPRFSSELMQSLAAMPTAGYGPLIHQLLAAPEMLPTYQLMKLLPAFRSWEQRRRFKVMLESEGVKVPFLDWLILRRLDIDKKDTFFTHVPSDCRDIVAQTALAYFSENLAFLVEILRLLDVTIGYQEHLAEFAVSTASTISLVPKLFARSLGEMSEALLLRVIDAVGFDRPFLLDNLALSSNPKHTTVHRRLIRWTVDVRQDLWAYLSAAKILRVHEPIALRRLLTEELTPLTESSLELLREVERATGNLLIDESGMWLDA